VSYIVFLLLYSILLLTNFYPKISSEEIVLIIWIVTIVCEEIRQVGKPRFSRYSYALIRTYSAHVLVNSSSL